MQAESRQGRETEIGLRAALPGELEVFYQPIVGADDEVVTGVEALVRWHHPTRGLLSAAAFLDVAEGSGMMPEINAWVLRQAAQQLVVWQERIPGARGLQMAVNLTPYELRQPWSAASIGEALGSSGVDPSCVVFEFTEAALAEEEHQVVETVAALRGLGTIVSIDDFAAGHAAISYLRRFSIDMLKIDMSLVQSVGHDMRDEALCVAIFEMARALDLKSTAEGVETLRQYRFLRECGAEFMQGYFFAQPAPASACEDILIAGSTSRRRARGSKSKPHRRAIAHPHASSR